MNPKGTGSATFTGSASTVNALARAVCSAAVEVHRLLGPGHLESTYEEALAVELHIRAVQFERQFRIPVAYKGFEVGRTRVDFLVGETLIVELKTVDILSGLHVAQVVSYLKASGLKLGLLINFNVAVLLRGVKRVAAADFQSDESG